jgi:hypothetical protein
MLANGDKITCQPKEKGEIWKQVNQSLK